MDKLKLHKIKSLLFLVISVLSIGMAITGCATHPNPAKSIICTTTIVADIVKNIKPPGVALMGPGVDPHLYKSKSGDHVLMNEAYVIVYSGLHLEGKMTEALKSLSKRKNVICLSDGISKDNLITSPDFGGSYDPHFWFDIDLYIQATMHCSKQLQKYFPSDSLTISNRTTAYISELTKTRQHIQNKIDSLNESARILITAHDAFGYFGKKYGFTVKGIQGASTAAEAGLKDITTLVEYIINHHVPCIFVESSVSEKNIKAILEGCKSKNHPVKLGGTLYSDALGAENSREGTYQGMMIYNVETIVSALKTTQP